MPQINVQILIDPATMPGKIGVRAGKQTLWIDEQAARAEILSELSTPLSWESLRAAIARRLRDDGVDLDDNAAVKASIERAPLDL